MTTPRPDVLADPLGVVVDLVSADEPTLDRSLIRDAVTAVAGGRAKRRRLAQALVDRPALLTDGRSPAPRVAGELLIALRAAGATHIAAPVCTDCDKQLRTLQRRGEDWYCGVCGPKREPCAVCGITRTVNVRDRDGRPRCRQCPPDNGQDPVHAVVRVVRTLDPALPADVVAIAMRQAARQAGQRYQLAWALQDRPELLTGAGAEASITSVLRLIDKLCDQGAQKVTHPACPRCDRVIHLHRRIDGQWLCRNCVAKSRAQPCSRCGVLREAATRDNHGRPLCPHCLITDPANQENCVECGRRRPVSVRTPEGPLCPNCRPVKTMVCSICGRSAPCELSKVTGEPWCGACSQRWARCVGCGQVKPTKSGTIDHPLCATCTRPDPGFWKTCPLCGETTGLRAGPCSRCALARRLRQLFADGTGAIRPQLQALYDNLVRVDRPASVLRWLTTSEAPRVLGELCAGDRPLTHEALDELPASKTIEHLRSILVATGALPARDEHMVRLERWVKQTIAGRSNPDEQTTVAPLRRLAPLATAARPQQRHRDHPPASRDRPTAASCGPCPARLAHRP